MCNWYFRFKTDNTLDFIQCDSLSDMYKAIDCSSIEVVSSCKQSVYTEDVRMIVDGDGLMLHKHINLLATYFYSCPLDDYGLPLSYIAGDVLFGLLKDYDVIGFDTREDAFEFANGLLRSLGFDAIFYN